eukprot:1462641-Pleurochrysis_carterae.AAC.1
MLLATARTLRAPVAATVCLQVSGDEASDRAVGNAARDGARRRRVAPLDVRRPELVVVHLQKSGGGGTARRPELQSMCSTERSERITGGRACART